MSHVQQGTHNTTVTLESATVTLGLRGMQESQGRSNLPTWQTGDTAVLAQKPHSSPHYFCLLTLSLSFEHPEFHVINSCEHGNSLTTVLSGKWRTLHVCLRIPPTHQKVKKTAPSHRKCAMLYAECYSLTNLHSPLIMADKILLLLCVRWCNPLSPPKWNNNY